MRRLIVSALAVSTFFAARPVLAARPALDGSSDPALILASGQATAPVRSKSDTPPTARAKAALQRFVDATGQSWRSSFDSETGVPSRLWGGKISVPGSVGSPKIAEAAARELFLRHAELFAPGLVADDLVLAANDLSNGMRTVAFFQRHQGLEVEGGQLSVRFKNDRLFVIASEAWPDLRTKRPTSVIGRAAAERSARAFIRRAVGVDGTVESMRGPLILPLSAPENATRAIDDRAVVELRVRTKRPAGLWSVYLDAVSGEPIARRQRLMFASGTLQIDAPERWPGGTRRPYPASHISARIGGQTVVAEDAGVITWAGADTATVSLGASGSLVQVVNQTGPATTVTARLAPGGSFTWSAATTEREDAQLVTYVATETVKARAAHIAPELGWINGAVLTANVNIDDICNAFSDGETTNFFRAGGAQGVNCENTGRIPDVVYHEFGHAFHFHAIIPGVGRFDTPFSEGASDYLAATITGDQGMGRGFFFDNSPLRELDPAGEEAAWPDSIARDPHETGLIFAGAMWDLRKALVAELGESAGVELADHLFYAALQRAVDIPTTYVEILAADDDDGDLSNGTPHVCLIDDAFSPHGIADANLSGPGLGLPVLEDRTVYLDTHRMNTCPGTQVSSIVLDWQIRDRPSSSGQVPLTFMDPSWSAPIPVDENDVVVLYKVTVTLANGTVLTYPNNPADPMYQMYLGPVTQIYCTDFESDPLADGWTHGLLAGDEAMGAADDWELGTPNQATASGDPGAAHSGVNVFGNDLGNTGNPPDGRYTANTTNVLLSPIFDVTGFAKVRLQYWRWLTVEDGSRDQANILSNGKVAWTNLATTGGLTHHIDREWRFQDVDLTPYVGTSTVDFAFEIVTNRRRRFGGWNVDDVCIVGIAPVCGNGKVEVNEVCDDGNTTSGDGCEADCTPTPPAVCGNGKIEAGETCDDGNTTSGDGCEASCTPTTPFCGNGVVETGETCDDGKNDGTVCTSTCQFATTTLSEGESGCGCATTRSNGAPASSVLGLAALGIAMALRRRRGDRKRSAQ